MKPHQTTIKLYSVINWLLSNNDSIPQDFIDNKTKLNSVVPYITEQLWAIPQLTYYLNKHLNDLYNIPDPIETLNLLKKIIKVRGITKYDLWSYIPTRSQDLIKVIADQEEYDEGNARSKEMMLRETRTSNIKYQKFAATKANVKKNSSSEVREIVQKALDKKPETPTSGDIYLPSLLTQELIDEQELVLFDISLLKKTNQVLSIFIDKNNLKKYHLKPFSAKIYISKIDGVINNDYIEDLTEEHFNGYIINNIQNYTKLKYMLGNSYKKILNGDN